MGHGRPFKLSILALVAASALALAAPASTAEFNAGRGE